MNKIITQFTDARNQLLSAVEHVDDTKASEVIFDKWNLKQVVSHLIGWDQFLLQSIADYRQNKKPAWYGDIQSFNQHSVSSCSSKIWSEIIAEYQQVGDNLLKQFQDSAILDQKIWPKKSTTPISFLKTLTHHSQQHLDKIKHQL